ncbi:hypothetical protein HK104_003247 [Borealophlyctis nickersoniae]|nr:hypothetical protein HK104_003247 [Borealophlyctis nickersoniae]
MPKDKSPPIGHDPTSAFIFHGVPHHQHLPPIDPASLEKPVTGDWIDKNVVTVPPQDKKGKKEKVKPVVGMVEKKWEEEKALERELERVEDV